MKSIKLLTVLSFVLLLASLMGSIIIPCVYAQNDEAVDLMQFPQKLADQLMMPLFAGQILATSIVTALFCMIPIFARNPMGTVIMGILAFSLCLALGWLPTFLMVLLVLMVVILLGAKMRDWVGGKGGDD